MEELKIEKVIADASTMHGEKICKIKNCYNLYSTPIGYKYFVVFTIAVDGNMSTYKSHELANHLEKDVEALDKIDKAVVHVHPVDM